MKRNRRIEGQTIVITGASSGAGRAIAVELAALGARLVLAARRTETLEEVVQECRALGGEAIAVPTDTRNADEVHDLARAAYHFSGAIDVWVNNAGVLAAGALDEVPHEVNENVIRTNLIGYMNGAHAVLPYFKVQERGILINNISVGGWFPTPYAAAYSASKFGLRGFSESIKGELRPFPNIHVCDLYPGFLDTPGIQHAANYTGKVLKPAPPIYDPRMVARMVVRRIERPRSRTMDGASLWLRFSHALFPTMSRNATGAAVRTYLRQAEPIETTSGNVVAPVEYGQGIDGGWRVQLVRPKWARTVGLGLMAGLALGAAAVLRSR